ncbi:hypothetical protein BKD30_04215 [Tersicoccus phoenicis]|uniref:Rv3660c-like CheY-like N-terminal domain-containing protein n=1 Tax=Tersicoccus phoenicis TaxID=554083 RepID=A0A1R1LHG8_9MICC|nr:hypothetical protein BKD30_04215 [Tersicoccus phoenicis]
MAQGSERQRSEPDGFERHRSARHRFIDAVPMPVDRSTSPPSTGSCSTASSGWVPRGSAAAGVFAVTDSDLLQAEIERVASAARCPVTLVRSVLDPALGGASVVLLGSDVALATLAVAGSTGGTVGDRPTKPWRGTTIIVGLAGEGTALWDAAGRWGADRVAVVPEAAAWLVDVLDDGLGTPPDRDRDRDATERTGAVVGVVGACGGVGATSVCVAVAEAARRARIGCLLVDADPLGHGLDVILAAGEPGVRWTELSEAAGRIPGDQLSEAVPRPHGIPLLGGGVTGVPVRVLGAVAAAAREAFSLAVVDIGRDRHSVQEWSGLVDRMVVVLPGHGQARLPVGCEGLDPEGLLAVVAGSPPDGLDAEAIAATVGALHYLPWRALPSVGRRLGAGLAPTDLSGRRCSAPDAILHFAQGGTPR